MNSRDQNEQPRTAATAMSTTDVIADGIIWTAIITFTIALLYTTVLAMPPLFQEGTALHSTSDLSGIPRHLLGSEAAATSYIPASVSQLLWNSKPARTEPKQHVDGPDGSPPRKSVPTAGDIKRIVDALMDYEDTVERGSDSVGEDEEDDQTRDRAREMINNRRFTMDLKYKYQKEAEDETAEEHTHFWRGATKDWPKPVARSKHDESAGIIMERGSLILQDQHSNHQDEIVSLDSSTPGGMNKSHIILRMYTSANRISYDEVEITSVGDVKVASLWRVKEDGIRPDEPVTIELEDFRMRWIGDDVDV